MVYGFFYPEGKAKKKRRGPNVFAGTTTVDYYRKGCKRCTLNNVPCYTPMMEPTGNKTPLFMVLGEAPGENEDRKGRQFVGVAGQFLREQFPKQWTSGKSEIVLFDNSVRCRPPGNRTPTNREIECCKLYTETDVETYKPPFILGTGATPLTWILGVPDTLKNKWENRLVCCNVGEHTCWYFPILHPSAVLRSRDSKFNDTGDRFDLGIRRFKGYLDLWQSGRLANPVYYGSGYFDGVDCVTGKGGWEDIQYIKRKLEFLSSRTVAIDIETTGLRPYPDESLIATVAIGTFDYVLSFPVSWPGVWTKEQKKELDKLIVNFLLLSSSKIAHKLTFEQEWLAYFYGIKAIFYSEWQDTKEQAFLLDDRSATQMTSLDTLTRLYYGFNLKPLSANVDVTNILACNLDDVLLYNGGDAKWTYKLYFDQGERMNQECPEVLEDYKRKITQARSVVAMQLRGVPVDLTRTKELERDYKLETQGTMLAIKSTPEVRQYEKKFGTPFNPSSPDQVVRLYKDVLKLPELLDRQSSDEAMLKSISKYKSARLILDYRTLRKMASTYLTPIPEIVDKVNLIHTFWNLMVTRTGRLSSTDPNLQNFPQRKHKNVRSQVKAILTEEMFRYLGTVFSISDFDFYDFNARDETFFDLQDFVFLKCDQGQIEARIIAVASDDSVFLKYIWEDHDIHKEWAELFIELYEPLYNRVIKDYKLDKNNDKAIFAKIRFEIKNSWVFPSFYGAELSSRCGYLQIPERIGRIVDRKFWQVFDGVKVWQEKQLEFYRSNGYVSTLTGRRLRGPLTKNQIFNLGIQGTAADVVTDAMDRIVHRAILENDIFFIPVLNIHDDLTFMVPRKITDFYCDEIAREMACLPFDWLTVPLSLEIETGKDWENLEGYKTYNSYSDFGFPEKRTTK